MRENRILRYGIGAACLVLPALLFALGLWIPAYGEARLFRLPVALAAADLFLTATLYITANCYGWKLACIAAAAGLAAAFFCGEVPHGGLLAAYALGCATYIVLACFMRKDDVRVRVAAPLFGKFVMVWLVGLQMVLPTMGEIGDLANTISYTVSAPHVVTCLLGSALGALICTGLLGQPANLEKRPEKEQPKSEQ